MKNYKGIILDVDKRHLILKTLLKECEIDLSGKEKLFSENTIIKLEGTTLTYEIKNIHSDTDTAKLILSIKCELIDNTFRLTYNEVKQYTNDIRGNNNEVWECPLIELDNYIFLGFVNKEWGYVMNLVRLCYTCLIVRHTWIYDYRKDFNKILFDDYSNYLFDNSGLKFKNIDKDSLKSVVCNVNEEATYEVEGAYYNMINITVNHLIELVRTYWSWNVSDSSKIKEYVIVHSLLEYYDIYNYIIKKFKYSKEFTKVIGINNVSKYYSHSENSLLQIWLKDKKYNTKEIKQLYEINYDIDINISHLTDIKRMLYDNDVLREYAVNLKDYSVYENITRIEELKFKELLKLKERHDRLIPIYNRHQEAYKLKQNKGLYEKLKTKYNNSLLPKFVDFLKSKNHNAYLLDTYELFIDEGTKQHHCVSSYVNMVARIESDTYGIIHYDGYTVELELKNNDIKQFRGLRNQSNDEKESEFRELLIEFNNNKQ